MGFHLGKPIGVMIVLAGVTGLITRFTGSSAGRADIEVWTFADSHQRQFTGKDLPADQVSPVGHFEADTNLKADVKLIQYRALNTRLSTLFLGNVKGPELPDVVEIEIGTVGRFFNAPADQVGFLPLNDLLTQHGWDGKIVKNRLASWSKDGVIFGVPCDVHPTTIAYNDHLFRSAGIDLATSKTWDEFAANCLAAQKIWREQGALNRWAIELPQNSAGWLVALLLQRGVSLIDAKGEIHLTDPRVLDTLVQYCKWCVGPERIAVQPSSDNQVYSSDMGNELMGSMLAPDWRVTYLRQYAPGLAGKVRLMPLPRWPDSDLRTTTMGGTAIAIPRNASNPEASWKMIEQLALGPSAVPNGTSYTLPAVRTLWTADPRIDEADPYYSGQKVRQLIAELAEEVPTRFASPASSHAEVALGQVLIDAIGRYRGWGGSEAEFRDYCAARLAEAERLVKMRIEHATPANKFRDAVFDVPPTAEGRPQPAGKSDLVASRDPGVAIAAPIEALVTRTEPTK